MRDSLHDRRRGFSMVEVVMALGVVTFCLLTLLGLLAIGISSDKATIQQSVAANIAGAAMADLRATPLSTQGYAPGLQLFSPRFRFVLAPTASTPAPVTILGMQTVYVDDDGTPLTAVNAKLATSVRPYLNTYRVTVMGPQRPAVANQRTASPVYILVTWPGQADPDPTSATAPWPSHYTGSFQAVTYLDQN